MCLYVPLLVKGRRLSTAGDRAMLRYLCVLLTLSAVLVEASGQTCIEFNNLCAFIYTRPRQEGGTCQQNTEYVDVVHVMQENAEQRDRIIELEFQLQTTNQTLMFLAEHCQLESAVDPCNPNPCVNGGTCTQSSDSSSTAEHVCQCLEGYSGNNCESALDPCNPNPCNNGGTCVLLSGSTDRYECQCPPSYSGNNCESAVDHCNPNPCNNDGICSESSTSGYFCYCQECYSGHNCELDSSPCRFPGQCLNGGTCIPTYDCGNYSCVCKECYTGHSCETPMTQPCSSNPCQNGGTCQNGQGCSNYTCVCDTCHHGTHCETMTQPCSSNPCQNGGTCQNDQGQGCSSYTCVCETCYFGTNCDTKYPNPCEPDPCLNPFSCYVHGCNQYTCDCQPGMIWTGSYCKQVV